jgi:hypothetical protein
MASFWDSYGHDINPANWGSMFNQLGGDFSDWAKKSAYGPTTAPIQGVGNRADIDTNAYRALNAPAGEAALGSSLQDTIAGKNGSIAQQQYQQNMAQNSAQQLGFASGLGGLNAALARRTAAENIGRQNQVMAGQTQMNRTAEIQGAQKQLGDLYGQENKEQLSQEQLAEKAYADQLESQNKSREQNTKIFGGGLSALSALL